MRAQFSSFEQYSIASADIDPTHVSGCGGAVAPVIVLPVNLDINCAQLAQPDGLRLVSFLGKLLAENNLFALSQEVPIGTILHQHYNHLQNELIYLEFPMDIARISAIERIRNGGEIKFRLDGVLTIERLHALVNAVGSFQKPTVWGHVREVRLTLQADLSIPRDAWISRVLPQVGYGVIQVLEFPAAPLEACASLHHAFTALQQAQELQKIGQYDDAVGKCRVALDRFFEYEEKSESSEDDKPPILRRIPRLKRAWETELGAATYAWLDASIGAIKKAANRPHHSPMPHYSQFDSQMILAITTSIIAYVARTVDLEAMK